MLPWSSAKQYNQRVASFCIKWIWLFLFLFFFVHVILSKTYLAMISTSTLAYLLGEGRWDEEMVLATLKIVVVPEVESVAWHSLSFLECGVRVRSGCDCEYFKLVYSTYT